MTTVTYNFNPNDLVWVITPDKGIIHGQVVEVEIVVKSTGTVITYDVRPDSGVTASYLPPVIFADADLAGALAAYQTILLS